MSIEFLGCLTVLTSFAFDLRGGDLGRPLFLAYHYS